jgi:hypothetical protein
MYDKSKNRVFKHGAALAVLVIFGLLALGSGTQQASTKTDEPREEILVEVQYHTTPEIGVETDATVGNSLIKDEWEVSAPVNCIFVKNGIQSTDRSAPPLPGGLYIPAFKQGNSTVYVAGNLPSGYVKAELYETNGNLTLSHTWDMPDWKSGGTNYPKGSAGAALKDGDFTRQTVKYDTSGNFAHQLSFTGVTGTVIRFTYRGNGISEPLTYDMAEFPDKMIQFQNAAFEIVEYSNRSVKYKLLSGFLTPTQGKTMTPIEIVAIAKGKAAK